MTKDTFQLIIAGKLLSISHDETILQCAYRHEILLKYHCASGHCGKCKIKLISGNVILRHSGGISKEDIDLGYILTCCSTPISHVEI
ncbi:2Fe-2S iron-sulfur cluster binding domain-containing protein [Rouxiella sp. S1S-2]|uniref:2Fe-2S iron-sulfur cluster-binding protein n=1 Tax=Rouxiella sp. S1S-2 TaxID=2653856 RepID=UPI001264D104|nr:2Fe-2S iron-sulfur cluster-binding protein [Rouxiella sp. S1S-2]KAB7894853.1 2Fe-2S iron-sulfur cluster binding domain-containing protein [Rouxiella sp. S1S-2]